MRARKHPSSRCGRCGGAQRHRSHPVAFCGECNMPICAKHAVAAPERGGYVCAKCSRPGKAA